MKFTVKGPFEENADIIMLRSGYARHPHGESYMKRIGGSWYPRFHVYITDRGSEVEVSLHIDQKEHTYSGSSRHQGEYDSPIVLHEGDRIRNSFEAHWIQNAPEVIKQKKSFWEGLLG